MHEEILPATVEEIPVLAEMLARSFHDDPMITWPLVVSEDGERIALMFLWLDTELAAEGWIWRTHDRSGVMSLIPPGADERLWAMDRAARPKIGSITPDGGARYAAFWDRIGSCYPDEPHWMIDQLAVDPARQGEGIGSSMMRFALDRASADGAPAVLETAKERNVAYYRRFGFRVFHDGAAPDGGPHIWFMRRESR